MNCFGVYCIIGVLFVWFLLVDVVFVLFEWVNVDVVGVMMFVGN